MERKEVAQILGEGKLFHTEIPVRHAQAELTIPWWHKTGIDDK